MKKFFIVIAFLPLFAMGQPHYSQVLKDIEAKNPTLLAASKQAEADKATAHVGFLIPNPEVEAAYFIGSPSEIGNRWDLSVSQSFEMPSVIIRRARLRNLQSDAANISYQMLRSATLLEAQQLCADLVYYRNVAQVYSRRCSSAICLAQLYQKRYDAGDCSILEYNRAQMNLADVQNRAAQAALLEDHAIHELRTLMNDDSYVFNETDYLPVKVEPSFEQWYAELEMRNPQLRQLDNAASQHHQQSQLAKAEWLPEMSVGYASENVVGEVFRGVKVGLSIPIWSQPRAVKAAKLQYEASQEAFDAQRTQLFTHLRCMFHRHEALIRNVGNLRTAFSQFGGVQLLDKALEAGEISLEEYLQQVDFYYDFEIQIWDAAHELELLHLQLYSVEL